VISFKREPDTRDRFYILALDKGVEVGFAHAIYLPNTQTLVLLESELKDQYRGRGIGTRLYLEVVKEGKIESKGQPFQFIPDYLYEGKTSESALRVWNSLARRFKSSSHSISIT
jgi:predicted GNAT family acetyltransferase